MSYLDKLFSLEGQVVLLTGAAGGIGKALAAGLAEGKSVACAVAQAKKIMTRAIRRSLALGKGRGPVNVL